MQNEYQKYWQVVCYANFLCSSWKWLFTATFLEVIC